MAGLLSRLRGQDRSAPGERDEMELLRILRAEGASVRRVVFTRNRRTMASLGDGGSTLRLHRCFATAPDEVLRALASLFGSSGRSSQAVARRKVQTYLAEARPAAPPRRRSIPSADRPHLERLRSEYDRVNREHFGGALPAVPIFLSGRMKSRNGHFSTQPLEIVLSRKLCTDAEPGEAERTLRHEMIHLWQHVQGSKPGHGSDFRRWARQLGVHPRATRAVRWQDA